MRNYPILVVDDDDAILSMVEISLRKNFHQKIYTANSVHTAIQAIKKYKPRLLVMDIHLNEAKDGIDIFNEMKDEYKLHAIYLTAFKEHAIIEKAKQSNPDGFLIKPYKADQLNVSVKMCLNKIQVDDELESREHDLNLLFNNIEDLILVFNQKHQLIEFNQAALRILGFSEKELSKKTILELIQPEMRDNFSDALQEIETIGKETIETAFVFKNKKVIHFEASISRTFYRSQEVTMFIARDISERKQADKRKNELIDKLRQHEEELNVQNDELNASNAALELSKNRLNDLFDNAPVGYIILDKWGEIIRINNYAQKLLNISPNDLIKKQISKFFSQKQNQLLSKKLHEIRTKQTLVSGEFLIHPDRTPEPVWVRMFFQPDATKENTNVRCAMIDISESVRMKDQLTRSEQKFRILTEKLSDLIFIVNENLDIRFATPAVSRVLGYSVNEIQDMNLLQLVNRQEQEDFANIVYKVTEGDQQDQITDIEFIAKNSETRHIDCRISNMLKSQSVNGIVITGHDVTFRMKMQSELDRIVSELEIKNLDLNILNSELNEANATKDKFFSIIAHDLKNPFSTLIGFTDLLLEDYFEFNDTERFEMVRKIYNTAENTLKLLVNLLEWSRMQRGIMKYYPEKIDFIPLLKQIIQQLEHAAVKKKITIDVDLQQSIWVEIDKYMIATIVRNLVSNAIKFTARNGKIAITAKKLGNKYQVEVADDGIGMTKDQMDKLFKLESNTSTTGTDGERGTGLGLILCYDFIEKHDEKIWVESSEGKGSTFYFTMAAWLEK